MDEDLVEKARFGEGLNFTPAIWYYYNRDDKNTFIFGTYYTLGGRYDLTPSMWVEPGNAWVKEMRWQHLNKKFQFLAGLSHTSYERTRENTLEYTSGHQFKPELTFNYAPDNTQFFTAYYWGGIAGSSLVSSCTVSRFSPSRSTRSVISIVKPV